MTSPTEFMARAGGVLADWGGSVDAARWSADGSFVYAVSVTTTGGGYRFDLHRQADIVGTGWTSIRFGGWTSPTFDTLDVASLRAVVADEHRMICESRGGDMPHRIEWAIDGNAINSEPAVQPPPVWSTRPEMGEGCWVQVDRRGVEGRAGSWPVYCGKPSSGWAMCPEHKRERSKTPDPRPGGG